MILHLPSITGLGTGSAFTDVNNILTATGHYAACIVQAPKTGTISYITFNSNLNSGQVDVRIETVDASTGHPTGTLWGTNTNLGVTISATGFITATLTAGASVTLGDKLAVVIRWVSGSPRIGSMRLYGSTSFPYRSVNTGSSAKGNSGEMLVAAIGYSDGSYEYIPYANQFFFGVTTFNSGSTPDEIGNLFTLSRAYSAVGIWGFVGAAIADFEVVLYSDTTAIATVALDKDLFSTSLYHYFTHRMDSVNLSAGTQYRLVYKPGASDLGITRLVGHSANARGAMPGGSAWQMTSRTNAGSWSQTDTNFVLLGLLVDDSAVVGVSSGIAVLTGGGLVR